MNNCLFIKHFFKVACTLRLEWQSRNNKNRPNKNNDVITDLGGGGNFPMFLFVPHISATGIDAIGTFDTAPRSCLAAENDYLLPRGQWPVSA
jgi:hypothetical protein